MEAICSLSHRKPSLSMSAQLVETFGPSTISWNIQLKTKNSQSRNSADVAKHTTWKLIAMFPILNEPVDVDNWAFLTILLQRRTKDLVDETTVVRVTIQHHLGNMMHPQNERKVHQQFTGRLILQSDLLREHKVRRDMYLQLTQNNFVDRVNASRTIAFRYSRELVHHIGANQDRLLIGAENTRYVYTNISISH